MPAIDQILTAQAQKEVTANAGLDAVSVAGLFGRRASTCVGLSWGYYGGTMLISGALTQIANGAVTLAASATNYIEANPTTGAVTANTSGFTSGRIPLYKAITGTSGVTSWEQFRLVQFATMP